jgi:WD40 repeat protein
MREKGENKVSVWRWFGQGFHIAIRHWPLFAIGTSLILFLEFLTLYLNPRIAFFSTFLGSPGIWILPDGRWPMLSVFDGIVYFILLPLIFLGMKNIGAEAANGAMPTLRTLFVPLRYPFRVFRVAVYRCLAVMLRLLCFVLPGVREWVCLSFAPLATLRTPTMTVREAAGYSLKITRWDVSRMLVFRGVLGLIPAIFLEMLLFSMLNQSPITGVVLMIVVHLIALPWWAAAFGASYHSLCDQYESIKSPHHQAVVALANSRVRFPHVCGVLALGIVVTVLAAISADRLDTFLDSSIVDSIQGTPVPEFHLADGRIQVSQLASAEFFPSGDRLAIGTNRGVEIRLMEDFSFVDEIELTGTTGDVKTLAIAPSGERLAAFKGDSLYLLNASPLAVIWERETESSITALAFDPSSGFLLCGYRGSSIVETREAATGAVVNQYDVWEAAKREREVKDAYCATLGRPTEVSVFSVQWDSSGRNVLASSSDGNYGYSCSRFTVIWDTQTELPVAFFDQEYASFTDQEGLISIGDAFVDIYAREREYVDFEWGGMDPPRSVASVAKDRMVLFAGSSVLVVEPEAKGQLHIDLAYTWTMAKLFSVRAGPLMLLLPWASNIWFDSRGEGSIPRVVSDDIEWLLSWGKSSRIQLWSLDSEAPVLDYPNPYLSGLIRFASSGKLGILWGSGSSTILVNLEQVNTREVLPIGADDVVVNRKGDLCVIRNWETLSVWKPGSWTFPLYEITMERQVVNRHILFPDLCFADDGHGIWIWDGISIGKWTFGSGIDTLFECGEALATDLTEHAFAWIDATGIVSVLDLDSGITTQAATVQTSSRTVAVSQSGDALAIADGEGHINLCFTDDGSLGNPPDEIGLRLDTGELFEDSNTEAVITYIRFLGKDKYVAAVIRPEQAELLPTWNDAAPSRANSIVAIWEVESGQSIFRSPAGFFLDVQSCPAMEGISVRAPDDILFWRIPELVEAAKAAD